MQVQIIQYRNAGDDEIETFRITITSHRWSWVNIYSFYKVDPGSKKECHPLLFLTNRRVVESPAGQRKRGPFGSPFPWSKKGAVTNCVGPGNMYSYVHKEQHSKETSTYITMYKYLHKDGWTVTSLTLFVGSVTIYNFLQA